MRVAVTQAEPGATRTAGHLRAAGFDVDVCPLIRIELVEGPPIDVGSYDWVVVTSRNAVEPLLARAEGELRRVAAIGPGTAAALREHGLEPALIPRVATQEGLAAELPRPAGRVLLAAAEGARDVLVHELDAELVPVYRTIELRPELFPPSDVVLLASASAARSFGALGAARPCVAIGPVTAAEAKERGLDVVAEAETPTAEGLVAAVKLAQSRLRSSRS